MSTLNKYLEGSVNELTTLLKSSWKKDELQLEATGTGGAFRCVPEDTSERRLMMYGLTSGRSGRRCVHVIIHRFGRAVPKIKLISLNTCRRARTSDAGTLPLTE